MILVERMVKIASRSRQSIYFQKYPLMTMGNIVTGGVIT